MIHENRSRALRFSFTPKEGFQGECLIGKNKTIKIFPSFGQSKLLKNESGFVELEKDKFKILDLGNGKYLIIQSEDQTNRCLLFLDADPTSGILYNDGIICFHVLNETCNAWAVVLGVDQRFMVYTASGSTISYTWDGKKIVIGTGSVEMVKEIVLPHMQPQDMKSLEHHYHAI